jgi:triosephosphate isomerase
MSNTKLIVSNWKDYIENLAQAQDVLDGVNDLLESMGGETEWPLIFCPKEELINGVSDLIGKSHLENSAFLGAQDLVDNYPKDLRYVILGHSSRRWELGEEDAVVNNKIKKAIERELLPIVCIGEKERAGDAEEFIKNQIDKTFYGLTSDQIDNCVIAYEPVWAITGNPGAEPDNPELASSKIDFIKKYIKGEWNLNRDGLVLYGGSVSSDNVLDFLSKKNIDGVLIGKASTIKFEFIKILSAVIK